MRKIILIDQDSKINSLVEAMMRKTVPAYSGGRGRSKELANSYAAKADRHINNTPFGIANKIKDEEGYVDIVGFGKIHIQNWIDRMIDLGDGDLIPSEVLKQALKAFNCKDTVDHASDALEYSLFDKSLENLPLNAMQKRFTRLVFGYPLSETVQIYDRIADRSYTMPRFTKLCSDMHKALFNTTQSLENLSEKDLDELIAQIHKNRPLTQEEVDQLAKEKGASFLPLNFQRQKVRLSPIQSLEERSKEATSARRECLANVAQNLNKTSKHKIKLNAGEIQSQFSRVDYAERLILQLPPTHDGRNTWLLNYGKGPEANQFRRHRQIPFDDETQSAALSNSSKDE